MGYFLRLILFCRNFDTLQEGGGPAVGSKKSRPKKVRPANKKKPPQRGAGARPLIAQEYILPRRP